MSEVSALIRVVCKKTLQDCNNPNSVVRRSFDASKGELRKLNVTAGAGGRSYMNWMKVPMKLKVFCEELNKRRKEIDTTDELSIYELSFWAHYHLVTIHPWADGNGRISRLLMNLLQMEYDVLPTKVYKEDKAEYIQALIDTREAEDTDIFINCMAKLHCEHLQQDIDHFLISTSEKMVDKTAIQQEMVDKAYFGREIGRYYSFHGRQRRNQNRATCHTIGPDRNHSKTLSAPTDRVRLSGSSWW